MTQSLSVIPLEGASSLVLDGRMSGPDFQSAGQWTCGVQAAFGGSATGEARRVWRMGREYAIE